MSNKLNIVLVFLLLINTLAASGINSSIDTSVLNSSKRLIENKQLLPAEKIIEEYLATEPSINKQIEYCYLVSILYNNGLFYELSKDYANKGIQISQNAENFLLVELYQALIINEIDLENFDNAEFLFKESLPYLVYAKKNVIANHYNLIGEVYRHKKEFSKSIKSYTHSIDYNQKGGYKKQLLVNYNNIGLAYIGSGNIDSANYYLNRAKDLIFESNDDIRKPTINISYGELFLKTGNFEKAIDCYNNVLEFELQSHPDKNEVLKDVYYGLYQSQLALQHYEEALQHYRKYIEYRHVIKNYKSNAQVIQRKLFEERLNHQKEIEVIDLKLEAQKKNNVLLTILFIAIVLSAVLVFFLLWSSRKRIKGKLELRKEKIKSQALELERTVLSEQNLQYQLNQSEQNRKISELETLRLKESIESKDRELASSAIHLLSKNEVLNKLNEEIEAIANSDYTKIQKDIKDLKSLINDSLRMDEDWKVFIKHFVDVHPGFFESLKNEYPQITNDELKLCAFLRIQLSSKEIARILNVTVPAINKRRNRLRKKLEMGPDEDFYGFLLKNTSE